MSDLSNFSDICQQKIGVIVPSWNTVMKYETSCSNFRTLDIISSVEQ